MSAPEPRGWCPGLRRPMATGDGLLARVHPPGGVLTAAQARLVAAAARDHGNGLIDVTARGNLQIRGLTEASHVALVDALAPAGLAEPGRRSPEGEFGAGPVMGRAGLLSPLPLAGRGWGDGGALSGRVLDGTSSEFCTTSAVTPTPNPSPQGGGARPPRLDPTVSTEPAEGGPSSLTLVSPLSGLDPAERVDLRPLAAAIEAGVARGMLPAKIFVALDGGGAYPLLDAGADLLVVALDEAHAAIGLDGPAWLGSVTLDAVPATIARLLDAFAAWRDDSLTDARRLRDLGADLRARLAALVGGPAVTPAARPAAPRAGLVPLAGGTLGLVAVPPFGRCDAERLDLVAGWAARHGSGEIRPTPGRGLLVPGLNPAEAARLPKEAAAAGFVVEPADPRLSVSACPGAPACASAHAPAATDAAALAKAARDLLAAGMRLHVSGCPKGCAHPGAADLVLVGRPEGGYGIVRDGTARDPAALHLSLDRILALLPTLNDRAGVARAFPGGVR